MASKSKMRTRVDPHGVMLAILDGIKLRQEHPEGDVAELRADLDALQVFALASIAESLHLVEEHLAGPQPRELDPSYEPEPEEYDPGPEVDDEGGMSDVHLLDPSGEWDEP